MLACNLRETQAKLLIAVLVVGAIVSYGFVFTRQPEQSDWYLCFVRAAVRMQNGQAIHVTDRCAYGYPPLMAMLTMPLAELSPAQGLMVWYFISLTALYISVVYAWRLIGGPRWSQLTQGHAIVLALGVVVSSRFILGPLQTRQFDGVITAILLAGCWQLRRGSDVRAGLLLGFAAGMKCTPLLFIPYLIWRGWYRAGLLLALTAIVANLLPEFCFPQASGQWYLVDWKERVLDVTHRVPPGTWFSGLLQNQSLAGMFQRLFRYGLPLTTDVVQTAKLHPDAVPLLRGAVYGASALLVAISVVIGSRRRSPSPTRDGEDEEIEWKSPTSLRFAGEISAVFALMLLLSPMTSRAHYLTLLLPALVVVRMSVFHNDRVATMLLVPMFICGPLTCKGILSKEWGNLCLAWSLPTWYALLCLFGMWYVLSRAIPGPGRCTI
jgi:hypothetical protein